MTTVLVNREATQGLLKVIDFLALASGGAALGIASHMSVDGLDMVAIAYLALTACFATMLFIRTLGYYEPVSWVRSLRSVAWSASSAIAAGVLLVPVCLFLPISLPAWLLGAWSVFACAYFAVSRGLLGWWAKGIAKTGGFHRRIAIVGGGSAAEEALVLLEKSTLDDIEIVGLFDDRNDTRSPDSVRKHRKMGTIPELSEYARNNRIDLIIVAIPMSAEKRLLHILKRLWELPVDIRISAAASELKLSHTAYTFIGDLPLLSVFDRPLNGWSAFFKDALDRIIAFFAIIALSPVMLGVALAVKYESKGPVIFRQKRYGFNNELIEVFKFRSMYTDMSDVTASKLVTKDDPRVTRVGKIIRKTSLDELPQLFNVMLGQLSLVGPRPHATHAKAAGTLYDEVVEGYFARHKVKPGITGWAQINGWRGETDTREKLEQRVKHDLEYIDKWSLGFDLYILAKTPFSLLKTENAY
jgi:Undecaprenyl-phosphate glucose phosphotransferase